MSDIKDLEPIENPGISATLAASAPSPPLISEEDAMIGPQLCRQRAKAATHSVLSDARKCKDDPIPLDKAKNKLKAKRSRKQSGTSMPFICVDQRQFLTYLAQAPGAILGWDGMAA